MSKPLYAQNKSHQNSKMPNQRGTYIRGWNLKSAVITCVLGRHKQKSFAGLQAPSSEQFEFSSQLAGWGHTLSDTQGWGFRED